MTRPENTQTTPVQERLLANLNPQQLQAVTLPTGNALILAGAGSGKTRVLTTRVAWLLMNGYASAGGIMAVTFTNKAAKEMLARITSILPMNTRGMWVGTFHGLCNRFLRMHWKSANLPQTFQILDMQDMQASIRRMLKGMDVDLDRFPPKEVMWFIAGAKEEGKRPKDIDVFDPDTQRKVDFYAAYQEQCEREGVVDFGELMLRCYEVLRDNAPIRQHYQQRFRHILVDEFQDTNRLQYAWLKMFSNQQPEHANSIFAVGDDDQSIYAFRGADINNMSAFQREYDVKEIIKLERNYRSFGHILDAANGLISNNVARLGKNLSTEAGAGEPIRVFEASSDYEEAQWIVDEVKQLHNEGIDRSEIALLYRSNAQSRVLENQLFSVGMPYRVYGGLRFFERAEVKHVLAYLRLLENPHDDTSYMRVVNFPARGIGSRTVEQLQDAAHLANDGQGISLYQMAFDLGGVAGGKLMVFNRIIDDLRQATASSNLKEIIEQTLEASGLIEHYQKEREGADRIENLKEVINAAEAFISIEGYGRNAAGLTHAVALGAEEGVVEPTLVQQETDVIKGKADAEPVDTGLDVSETLSPLAAFLSHASLEAGDNQAQAGEDAVQLMTVHAAKGLEFDCVFITGLEEGLFPHENSLSDISGLEEERRLMYVAITRARERLYFSFAQTRMLHGQMRYNMSSRFLDEVPEETMKWLTPSKQSYIHQSSENSGSYGIKSAPTSAPKQAQNKQSLSAGDKVFHNKFGEGVVLRVEGTGKDEKAEVRFNRHGVKWLAVAIAKLTPI